MKTSERGVAFIAAHEGVVTRAYKDVKGVVTIGVGHTAAAGGLKPKMGMTITRQEALNLFSSDLAKFETRVTKAMDRVAQPAFDGSTSFDFNTGAINRASWVKQYLAFQNKAAEAGLKLWNKSGGKTYKGLVRRRAEEADVIFRGKYPGDIGKIEVATPPIVTSEYATILVRLTAAEVETLRSEFIDLGYDVGKESRFLALPVEDFQAKNGLKIDAKIGPATLATVERAVEKKRMLQAAAPVAIGGGVVGGGLEAGNLGGSATDPAVDLDAILSTGGVGIVIALVLLGLGFLVWRNRGAISLKIRQMFKKDA